MDDFLNHTWILENIESPYYIKTCKAKISKPKKKSISDYKYYLSTPSLLNNSIMELISEENLYNDIDYPDLNKNKQLFILDDLDQIIIRNADKPDHYMIFDDNKIKHSNTIITNKFKIIKLPY